MPGWWSRCRGPTRLAWRSNRNVGPAARRSKTPAATPPARVATTPTGPAGRRKIATACRDRSGLLARLTGGLTEAGLDIDSASIATWADGAVLDTFTVRARTPPDVEHVASVVEQALTRYVPPEALPAIELAFDNQAL